MPAHQSQEMDTVFFFFLAEILHRHLEFIYLTLFVHPNDKKIKQKIRKQIHSEFEFFFTAFACYFQYFRIVIFVGSRFALFFFESPFTFENLIFLGDQIIATSQL